MKRKETAEFEFSDATVYALYLTGTLTNTKLALIPYRPKEKSN
jgi:hypothetical protein